MGYVLGLDLGPTSIGWAAIEVNEDGQPCGFMKIRNRRENGDGFDEIPALGSRIFPAGVDNINQGQKETPKNKKRREKRSVRRRLRRAKARRLNLISLLYSFGLIKKDVNIEEIQAMNPYPLRAKAVEEKIEPEELARIFLHFAKRRGFKSNRRHAEKDAQAGEMKKARERLTAALDGKTLGQFLYEKHEENPQEPIRNRYGDYHWIAQREQYREELGRIWQEQAKHWPKILTNEFYGKLEALLFEQIPFELTHRKKKKIIGTCSLIEGKPRCAWAERAAQKFRILQKVNDLIVTIDGESRGLLPEEKETLYTTLMNAKERSFEQIRKMLWKEKEVSFNLEYKANDKIKGNEIDTKLCGKHFFKKEWSKLADEQKEKIWDLLRDFLKERYTRDAVEEKIKEEFGLAFQSEEWVDKLDEPEGYCNYSREALGRLLPYLENGLNLYESIQEAGFIKKNRKVDLLPLPDRKGGFVIPNPVVRSMLYQLRKIVNLLIKEIGLPERIIIETARDLKANSERRQEIVKKQADNQRDREKCRARIREMRGWGEDVNVSPRDIDKYRLWEEQNHFCAYSCRKIPQAELFTEGVEIDHILPYSMSLDNTMNNRVVCFAAENQAKRRNTPITWLGEESERWEKIVSAMAKNAFGFSEQKWDRFCTKNEEIAEKFAPERLLRDTSYISREVRSYLKNLYPGEEAEQKVRTTKGPITWELRNLWKINSILRDGDLGPKNRDDLRHHAVDAVIIAVTSMGMIQGITRRLSAGWPSRPKKVELAEPWDGFRGDLSQAVETIHVSHRVQRKIRGGLHAETNYWKENHGVHKGKFITRKNLVDLTAKMAKQICDDRIRELVLERMKAFKGDAKKAFAEPLYLPSQNGEKRQIKKVRVWRNAKNMIQLKDNIWVEPGSNHHVEIFTYQEKGKRKYTCKLYTMWDVAEKIKEKKPVIVKEHPEYPDAEFVMSLAKGEAILIDDKDGNPNEARVLSISGEPGDYKKIDMEVRPLSCGDERNLSKAEQNQLRKDWRISSLQNFEKRNIRKVTVDPLGRIRRAHD